MILGLLSAREESIANTISIIFDSWLQTEALRILLLLTDIPPGAGLPNPSGIPAQARLKLDGSQMQSGREYDPT